MNTNNIKHVELFKKLEDVNKLKNSYNPRYDYKGLKIQSLICIFCFLFSMILMSSGFFETYNSKEINFACFYIGSVLFFLLSVFCTDLKNRLDYKISFGNIIDKLTHEVIFNSLISLPIIYSVMFLINVMKDISFLVIFWQGLMVFYGVILFIQLVLVSKKVIAKFKDKYKSERMIDAEIFEIEFEIKKKLKDSFDELKLNKIYCEMNKLNYSSAFLTDCMNALLKKKGYASFEDFEFKKTLNSMNKSKLKTIQNT